jgi:hypothetical protein
MASQFFSSPSRIVAVLAVLAVLAACSSGTDNSSGGAAPACDDTKCLPGNKCLALGDEVKCRKTCSSNIDPAASCPYNYTCVSSDTEPFCVADTNALTKGDKQWGASCSPTGGIDNNPDCDTAQGFFCYGTSPTDASAYCTRYTCTTDRDCAATYYCGSANVSPNVKTTKRSLGDTQKVCLKRTYCTPCTADLDCPNSPEGKPQHCVADHSTPAKTYCTPECGTNDNCNEEAKCVGYTTASGQATKVCVPRAGVCVGDGSVCAPCLSDDDCLKDGEAKGTGLCIHGQYYSTERSCAKKANNPCAADGSTPSTDCPAEFAGTQTQMRCLGGIDSFTPYVPPNYCHGLVKFGASGGADIACFTPAR